MTMNQVLTQSTEFFSQVEGELTAGFVVVSAVLLCTLLLSIKKTRKLDKQLTRMQHELKVSNNSVINIGQQLLNLEKKVNTQSLQQKAQLSNTKSSAATAKPSIAKSTPKLSTFERTLSTEPAAPEQSLADNNESVYDKARFYLSKGDSVESIAKRCNLSHAEVSLLKALSKNPAATS